MTLIENIKIALSLADEYSKVAGYEQMYTEDEDFQEKLKNLYAQPYQELSQIKPIKKTKNISRTIDLEAEDYYEGFRLPSDMRKIKEIIAHDVESNKQVEGDYYLEGEKIYININSNANYSIIYFAYPELINEDTEDDFELELDQDAQMVLPYKAIDNILKTDPSADYNAFKIAYDEAIQRLDLRETGMLLSIKVDYDF